MPPDLEAALVASSLCFTAYTLGCFQFIMLPSFRSNQHNKGYFLCTPPHKFKEFILYFLFLMESFHIFSLYSRFPLYNSLPQNVSRSSDFFLVGASKFACQHCLVSLSLYSKFSLISSKVFSLICMNQKENFRFHHKSLESFHRYARNHQSSYLFSSRLLHMGTYNMTVSARTGYRTL